MRRAAALAFALLLAGCTSSPTSAPVQVAEPCGGGQTGLVVAVQSVQWQPYPQASSPFWAPTATIKLCNGGASRVENKFLDLFLVWPEGWPSLRSGFPLPPLESGEVVNGLAVPADHGVPAQVGALWQQDGRFWPALSLEVRLDGQAIGTYPVARKLAGQAGPEAPGGAPMPATPSLEVLRAAAWSRASQDPVGQFFLYATDATYAVETAPSCIGGPGVITASAAHWGLWLVAVDGAPRLLQDLGQARFEGGRGLTLRPAPALGATLVLLGHYGSCNESTWHEIYAYDHASGTLYRPQMEWETGKTGGAVGGRFEVGADGSLVRMFYANAGANAGHNTETYRWDAAARTWRFVGRTVTK